VWWTVFENQAVSNWQLAISRKKQEKRLLAFGSWYLANLQKPQPQRTQRTTEEALGTYANRGEIAQVHANLG
jgi:hypothetical protein